MKDFKEFKNHIYNNVIKEIKENNEAKNQHEIDMLIENQRETIEMILTILNEAEKWKAEHNN